MREIQKEFVLQNIEHTAKMGKRLKELVNEIDEKRLKNKLSDKRLKDKIQKWLDDCEIQLYKQSRQINILKMGTDL